MTQIVNAQIKMYRAQVNADGGGSNGGRINDLLLVTAGLLNGIFRNVLASELVAGVSIWRKRFFRYESPDNTQADDVLVFLESPVDHYSPVKDSTSGLYLRPSTLTEIESAMASSRYHGVGVLDANVSASATSLDVLVKDGTTTQFADGDTVALIPFTPPNGVPDTSNIEFGVITGAPSVSVNVITITLTAGIANGYNAGELIISSCIDVGSLVTDTENHSTTSASGTLDDAQIVVNSVGAKRESLTIRFTSASAFECDGDTLGVAFATGNTGSPFNPVNPATGTALITIPSGAWGGTIATSDEFSFDIVPSCVGFWCNLDVNAGSPAGSNRACHVLTRVNSSA